MKNCSEYTRSLFLLFFLCLAWPVSASASKSGMSPQVLSLPSGPGSLGGIGENVKANLNMGLMSYQIKVQVPSGRSGMTPNPSISYSSSGGAGLMGIGWNFSAGSSIMRGTVRGLPRFDNADIFFAGSELVKIPKSSVYRSRYEGGFQRYRWVQKDPSDQRGYWIVENPNGSKMYYGANSKGELDLDAQVYGLKGTYCWKLVTMVDRNGNRVEYSYFKDGPQSYPDQISWVFDADGKPLYRLKFSYEERPDHISDGKPGFDLKTTKRIKEVRITSNGERFRSYTFQYEAATGLSRLIKVTQYGRDASKAHPVQFSMKYSDAVFSPENSKMVKMPTSLGVDFRSGNIDFLDINGDGLPDVVDTSKPKHIFHINQVTLKNDIKQDAHDFPKGLIKENLKETSAKLSNPSIQMLDVNGDGFTDMVDAVNKKIYINKGNAKWEDGSMSLQSFPVTGKDPNMRFMDYNGDKKIDVISSDGSSTTFWVSDGKGNWVVTPGKVNIGLGFSKDNLRLIDMNGDGLQDVVHITKNSLRYRKYLGYGEWTNWISMKVPGIDQYELSTKAQFDDINGDGMSDMVAFLGSAIVYFVNKNGEEFSAGKKLETFDGIDIPDASKMTIRIVDINGNGSRDIVWVNSSGQVTYLELFGKRPNLMEEISNGIGQRINVEYGSSVYFYLRDKTCKVGTDKVCEGPWQNKMPMAFQVVTKITTWASRSDKPAAQKVPIKEERPQIQSIFYHDGFYDGSERKFRGFRKVETLFDGDESVKARLDVIQYNVGDKDPYFHGKMLERRFTDANGLTYRISTTHWEDCPVSLGGVEGTSLDPPIRFICQKWQEITHIEGEQDKAKWKRVRTEMTYDGFGNVILVAALGDKDAKGDEKYTKQTYITPKEPNDPGSIWHLRGVATMWRCDAPPDGNQNCAEVRHYYDGEAYKGLPLGELRRGNLMRVELRVSQDKWVVPMRRKYDKYGNLTSYYDLSGRLREVEWDAVFHRFAVKESLKLNHVQLVATTEWDYALNKVRKSTDYNGHSLTYGYDSFGRMTFTANPEDPKDKPSIRFTYDLRPPLSRIIMEKRSQANGPFDRTSIQCFDGLGRQSMTLQKLGDKKYLVGSHVAFNRLGGQARIWSRYEATDDSCRFDAPSGVPSASMFYDGLGRSIRAMESEKAFSRIEYGPFVKRLYDVADNDPSSPHYNTPTIIWTDGHDRTIREDKTLAKGKIITTRFTYYHVNPRHEDKIASVTFADGSVKRNEYDLLGQVLRVIDPDRSIISYKYNEKNQLVERTDAQGRTLVWRYDELGRAKEFEEKGKPETRVTSDYDVAHKEFPAAVNLKGRVSRVTYPGGMYLFSYDRKGMPTLQRHVIMGVEFDVKRTFNTTGDALTKTFPDGHKIEFQRDEAGRLSGIPDLIKQILFTQGGQTKEIRFANGVVAAYSYTERQWLQQISIDKGRVFQLKYSFTAEGNVAAIEQTHGDQSFQNEYKYDALYRLTQATVGEKKEVVDYQLSDLYNVLSRTSSLGDKSPAHIGDYKYDSKRIHAATSAAGIAMSYDKSGYMTKRGQRSIAWDGQGRLSEVKEGEKIIARQWYSTGRRRVIKEENGVHTYYVADDFEIRDGVGVSYVILNGNRLVSRRSLAISARFFDDLAPASGDSTLTAKPDGMILAGDAWLYHASRQKLVQIKTKARPFDIDMTKDMLRASLSRMLDGETPIKRFHHPDHLGNIRATTDEKGAVVSRMHYYPYGAIRAQQGTTPVYAYMGAELDQATQTYRFAVRSMDIQLGRWWSPDPEFDQIKTSEDEFNSYALLMNNPIRMREYKGTSSLVSIAGGIILALLARTAQGIANEVKEVFSSEEFAEVSNISLMAISGAGLLFAVGSLIQAKRSKPSKKIRMRAVRKMKMFTQGMMAVSWALWGGAAAARQFSDNDSLVQGLNVSMLAFAAMAEVMTAASVFTEHVAKGKRMTRVQKQLIGARVGVGLAMVGSLALTAVGMANDNSAMQSAGTIVAIVGSVAGLVANEKVLKGLGGWFEKRRKKKAFKKMRKWQKRSRKSSRRNIF